MKYLEEVLSTNVIFLYGFMKEYMLNIFLTLPQPSLPSLRFSLCVYVCGDGMREEL